MTIEFTYTNARENLASLLDRVTKDREVVIIQRRGSEDVAMISADELAGLTETAYLLRSPQNAERLLSALGRALGVQQELTRLLNTGPEDHLAALERICDEHRQSSKALQALRVVAFVLKDQVHVAAGRRRADLGG